MTIIVKKPEILHNKYHLEREEKPVVEPNTKTSEDVHGGDEITQSIKDERFSQQNNNIQDTQTQQQNMGQSSNNIVENQQGNTIRQQENNNQQSEMNDNTSQSIQADNNTSYDKLGLQQANDTNEESTQQTTEQQPSNNDQQNNEDNGQHQFTSQQQSANQQNNEDESTQQNMPNDEQYPANSNYQQGNDINNGFTQQSENDQQSETNSDAQQNNDIQPSNTVSQQQTTSNDDIQQNNNTSQSNEDNTQNEKTGNNESTEQQQSANQQNNEDESTEQSSTDTDQQNEDEQQTNDDDQNDTEQQEDDNQLDDSTSDESEDYDDNYEEDDYDNDYEEEDEQEDTPEYNTQQAFEIDNNVTKRRLYLTFYRLVEYLSDEEKQPTLLPGQSLVLNVKKLMMRQYERKPINAYYYYRTRSQVILILDNSGSMTWLIDELDTFFAAALKRKDVQIYIAPNGHIESYYNNKTKRFEAINHDEAIQQIIRSGLPVIYVGDFDGANTPIELSWTNRVYWICPETRYKYFSHHDWVGRCVKEDEYGNCIEFQPYHEDDFKGFFGRTFDDKEMIEVLQQFAKNIYKQRFWYDNHDITDFKEEH